MYQEFFTYESLQTADGFTLPYRLYQPKNAEGLLPLVLFMHGAGERGEDNEAQLPYLMPAFLPEDSVLRQAIVVAPQCPADDRWGDVDWSAGSYDFDPGHRTVPMKAVEQLLDELCDRLPADPCRIYVTGLSMGGYATWELLMRYPERFAAAMPICGGGDPAQANALAGIPIYSFHSDDDPQVPVAASRDMAAAIDAVPHNRLCYTELTGYGHGVWTPVYADPENMRRLMSHRLEKE